MLLLLAALAPSGARAQGTPDGEAFLSVVQGLTVPGEAPPPVRVSQPAHPAAGVPAPRSPRVADLTAQLVRARADIRTLQARLQRTPADSGTTDPALTARITQLQARLGDAEKARDTLQAQLATAQATATQVTQARDALMQQLTAAGHDRSVAQQTVRVLQRGLSALQARLDAVGDASQAQQAAQTQLAQAQASIRTLQARLQRTPADSGTADPALTARVTQLQARLGDAEKARDTLQAQLAAAQSSLSLARRAAMAPPASPADAEPDLQAPPAQQTYASGVMMAGMLRRTLALQHDLGEAPDVRVFLAGVEDGVKGRSLLDPHTLESRYGEVVARLSDREKARYAEGRRRLETLTAGKTLLKRNNTLFFVQAVRGTRALKAGEQLHLSVRESTLDGRVLRDDKDRAVTWDARLPYLVHQAGTLGHLGGTVEVYCLASDVYPPTAVPPGLYAYTPMKYTVTARP
ncbi:MULTISPECIES: FKBP-type peptidyl-prolyl cis-trans isomerase N-terminal domain-containing protein [Serratia]|uniref:FKBP-type peptidyl-prolyl cis-trans isomerase N-terminal domain-containing protein n=3 Tax=Serratia TaxID=613 RepID=UPI00065FEF5B|nr:FKBP-type peptidyl-prolyl cis-trans isomerase N-terminal domain-containing protein [Serratia sp. 506_PEND]